MVLHLTANPASEKPLYVIYLGSRDRRSFTADEREGLAALICRYFPSFTLLDAQGYYQGLPLPTILVQVATKDRYALEQLCHDLGRYLGQKAIGLSHGGSFYQVKVIDTEEEHHLELKKSESQKLISSPRSLALDVNC